MSVQEVRLVADTRDQGKRLDKFLAEAIPDRSRTRLAALIVSGNVRVNGACARAKYRLVSGDVVEVGVPDAPAVDLMPQPMGLDIVYEDRWLVVVDKPAGLVVHPGAGNPDGTLINGLIHQYTRLSPIGLPDRPGVVHRIDKGTSGLLVFALDEAAHYGLSTQFAEHSVERVYTALIWDKGLAAEGRLKTFYGRHDRDRRKFTSRVQGGKQAVTDWIIEERLGPCSKVSVRLETGRTHQIRVHFSEYGFPLVGDQTYGIRRRVDQVSALRILGFELGLQRQALHAGRLGFQHPVTGEHLSFESPLPADLSEVIDALRQN
ncbi:MAG: RluA family pseudouridine synthase [Myxococcota bacterium]|nr:RluA family pseudouridine synthase [Myxococcota bacterium]